MNKMLNNTTSSKTQRKRRARAKKKLVKQILKGTGDYTMENTITDPAKRLEAKIDHLERSINKKATVNNAASSVGRALGSLVGQGDLGALAGSGLAKFFGHGDYALKSNSLVHALTQSGPNPPKFSSARRSIRVTEREFIGDVIGSANFTNTSYAVNPTNPLIFPWLSILAVQYDQWEPHGIIFEFVPTSASWSGSGQALGTVIMATDYDSLDAKYTSKMDMENSDYACSTKPTDHLVHGLECDKSERPTPVLYTSSAGGSDVRFSNLGNFQIATVGQTSSPILGELWVSYDITFYKKQLVTLGNLYGTLNTSSIGSVPPGTAIFAQYNTNRVIPLYVNNGFTLTTAGTSSILTFANVRPGMYVILFQLSSYAAPYIVTFQNMAVLSTSTAPSLGLAGENRQYVWVVNLSTTLINTVTFPTTAANSGWSLAVMPWDTNAGAGFQGL